MVSGPAHSPAKAASPAAAGIASGTASGTAANTPQKPGLAFTPLRNPFWRRLFRLRPIEPLPFKVIARRIYILPTRQGMAFSLLLLGMLVGAINYSLAMGFLFTFLLVGMMLSTLFATWRTLLGVSVLNIEEDAAFCGEAVHFRLTLQLPPHLTPHTQYGQLWVDNGVSKSEVTAVNGSRGEARISMISTRRGKQPVGACRLATEAPLGLFRAWTLFMPPSSARVWPKPAATGLPLPMTHGKHSEQALGHQRGTDDFEGLRSYQPGESPSRLAWQSLARQHGENALPLVKDFVSPVGGAIWLDWAALPAMETEARLSHLARWVMEADRKNLSYGLVLPDQRIAPGVGMLQRLRCLNALALYGLPPEVASQN